MESVAQGTVQKYKNHKFLSSLNVLCAEKGIL